MKQNLPTTVADIFSKMRDAGYQIYAIGGCVRNILLGLPKKDWDFTTNATPKQIQEVFPDSFYDNEFGTVGVPLRNDKGESIAVYEITTYRSESSYSDSRHPDKVAWGATLEEDLKRRDFTINAIAYDGNKIVDPLNGKKDLDAKIIRAVGDAQQRFTEDALRMMRAVRIATELGFLIEPETFAAIQNQADRILHIAWERIRDELIRILSTDYPADGIILLRNSGLLQRIIPELEACFAVSQKSPKRHHLYDVGTHLIMSLKHCPSKDPIVRLATLLHDIGKPATHKITPEGVVTFYNHEIVGANMTRAVCDRLRLSKKNREKIIRLVRWHQFTVDERQTDSAIRRILKNVGIDYMDDMITLRTGDRLGGGARETSWRLELFKKRLIEVQKIPFTVASLAVNGHDVMKILGIKPGPKVGEVLNAIFEKVEKGDLTNERELLLKEILSLK